MRQDMNRRYSQEQMEEDRFNTMLAGGANPLMMALAYPELYFRRTGDAVMPNSFGELVPFSPGSPAGVAPLGGAVSRRLAENQATRSGEAVQGAVRDEVLRRDLEAYGSPTARVLREMDPDTARRLVMSQTGFTKTYGYGGAPSEAQSAQELERVRQGPAMRKTALEEREYEESRPAREFALEAGKEKIGLEKNKQKIDALTHEMSELAKAWQTTYDNEGRATIYDRIQEIGKDIRTLTGIPVPAETNKMDPKKAQARPDLFKGQRFIGTDAKGRKRIFESDGKNWNDIGPAPA
jgi:hypothetical protein